MQRAGKGPLASSELGWGWGGHWWLRGALSVSRWLSARGGTHSSFQSKVGKEIYLGDRVEKRGLRGTVESEGVGIIL